MKKKIIIFSLLIFIGIIVLIIFVTSFKKSYKNDFVFTKIEKGNIKNIISATGTIKAKGTVEVGSQISGIVEKIYVNYNDSVKKGQLLAKLDTTLLEIALQQAQADLIKAESQYQHTLKDFENKENLFKSELISKYEFESARVNKDNSYASLLSAKANLLKAEANIKYAYIKSPIDGKIIDKNVEEGQTISSSLSAPTLFIIAEDLNTMEIEANVDETDISNIKKNTKVEFKVNAYKDITFDGEVKLIKLKPTVESNVVMYKVIIEAKNRDNLLLPGMTATIDFITEEKNDVYLVSNSAIRFTPDEKLLAKFYKNKEKKDQFSFKDKNIQKRRSKESRLWFMDQNNKLNSILVKTGINDGQKVELVEFPEEIKEAKIIIGVKGVSTNKKSSTQSTSSRPPIPMF